MTTYEERLQIVQDCLDHDKNYGAVALKYGCSYQQVRNWVKRYEEMGAAGLEDRRGKRAGTLPSRTKGSLSLTRNLYKYQAIQELSEIKGFPVQKLCCMVHVSRSDYYRWKKNPTSASEKKNSEIAEEIRKIHETHPDMGYRRINDELNRRHNILVNDKRVLRICRAKHIQSTIKWRPKGCTHSSNDPAYTAENLLNREFHAAAPNRKQLTDVSEFKYYTDAGNEVHKLYLSAILDL